MRKFLLSLVFAITAIAVQAQEPAIVMTTTKSVNSQFSFGIDAVAPNTPIQIDWGNGVKENFTIGDVTEFFGFPLKGSSVKIWGEGIASLNVTSMELTALDVTRATSLTYLYIKTNQIETLDLSNCTALTFVDCSENLLTSLNLPSTSTLTAVNCDNNLLTSLNVSGATGITELTCTNNKLTFATLPIKQPSWTTYTYSPQQKFVLPMQTYSTDDEIDLSSQLSINGNNTTYTWKTSNGTTLINGIDYSSDGGKFKFLKTNSDSVYCVMTNSTFQNLYLISTLTAIQEASSVITMTTTKSIGNSFSFEVSETKDGTPINVDWGDGTLTNYNINSNATVVSGTLLGNTIKIYGQRISYIGASDRYLTALDTKNAVFLKKILCSGNQLTSLDLSTNIALTVLACSKNKLTSLDVSKNIFLKELYCFTNQLTQLDLSKNPELSILYCLDNIINTLNISQNTVLQELVCHENKLTSLILKSSKLSYLSCYKNELQSLDISECISLSELTCYSNKLKTIDVSNNLGLLALVCSYNQLTNLNVSNNPALQQLYCEYNYLNFNTLPVKQPSWLIYDYRFQTMDLQKKHYSLSEPIDLSSQLIINDKITTYNWWAKNSFNSYRQLILGTDYVVTNGITTFRKVQTDSVYCQMTNATFPNLTLTTTNIKVSEYPLSVGNNEFALYVYPNPATNYFTIKMAEEIVRVEVYTITGVKVFENGLYNSTTVNVPLTSMPKGALLIKAYTRNGVYSGKVVKI